MLENLHEVTNENYSEFLSKTSKSKSKSSSIALEEENVNSKYMLSVRSGKCK